MRPTTGWIALFVAICLVTCGSGIVQGQEEEGVMFLTPSMCKTCDCYFSSDCSGDKWCDYGSGCTETNKPNGTPRYDGTCTKSDNIADPSIDFANAVDFRLQAYIRAGESGGGPQDTGLVGEAEGIRLSVQAHRASQTVADNALDLAVGFDGLRVYLQNCGGGPRTPSFEGNRGWMARLLDRMREGIVEAIKANDPSLVAGPVRSFWREYPGKEPQHSGRCYPHGHADFPYKSPEECQIAELQGMLRQLIPSSAEKTVD
jgi:hypothetical protein